MATRWIGLAGSTVVLMLATGTTSAQQQPQPKVPEAQARTIALAKVPRGHVKSYEVEQEGGRLIYSYDIEVPGRSGIEEVNVDAMTGAVVSVAHESAAAERAELRGDSAASATAESQTQPAPYGQWLVNRTVAAHPEIKSVEVAIVTNGACRTVAATAPEDVGEACDADENEPIRTGQPDVEAPSDSDPVYDITQALHDAHGTLIGAVGMDIAPGGMDRAAVVALADKVRREIEGQIPSRERLFGPAPTR